MGDSKVSCGEDSTGEDRAEVWDLSTLPHSDFPSKPILESGLRYFPKGDEDIAFQNLLSARTTKERRNLDMSGEVGKWEASLLPLEGSHTAAWFTSLPDPVLNSCSGPGQADPVSCGQVWLSI